MLGARASAITARKPTLIRSRKRRELVRRGEVDALIEDIAGTVFSVEPACAVRAGAIESSRALCEGHLGTAERVAIKGYDSRPNRERKERIAGERCNLD
jgi:hypothetical protein